MTPETLTAAITEAEAASLLERFVGLPYEVWDADGYGPFLRWPEPDESLRQELVDLVADGLRRRKVATS